LTFTATLALAASRPPFRVFTTQDGLLRNWAVQIRRDSQGYLWFCTVEGISLFDGFRFTNFGTRDGLPSRLVMTRSKRQQANTGLPLPPAWHDSIRTIGQVRYSRPSAWATPRPPTR
jgi:ligand-binding sensor domain-containing protein